MASEREEQSSKRVVVRIPSHAEVLEQSRPLRPLSLFQPSSSSTVNEPSSRYSSPPIAPSPSNVSQTPTPREPASVGSGQPSSFTEAFSFLRKTEFYSPPPPAAPPPPLALAPKRGAYGPSIGGGTSIQEAPLPPLPGQARNAIVVSRRQQGNPVLKHIQNVRWIFGDIVPDYLLGQTTCALYLSLRYHLLHPDYLYFRIRELLKSFRLRVVLCHIDVEDVIKPLHEVTKTALLHDCSLLCAWSLEECARYLETIKMYENKPADNIQERTDNDYVSRLTSALTTVRRVNKTDAISLGSTFSTMAAIMGASMEELARCPGIGERKVRRLHDAFHEPFRRTSKQLRLSSLGITTVPTTNEDQAFDTSSGSKQILAIASPGCSHEAATEPKISVRKALDAVYAKFQEQKNVAKDDLSRDRMEEHNPMETADANISTFNKT